MHIGGHFSLLNRANIQCTLFIIHMIISTLNLGMEAKFAKPPN